MCSQNSKNCQVAYFSYHNCRKIWDLATKQIACQNLTDELIGVKNYFKKKLETKKIRFLVITMY